MGDKTPREIQDRVRLHHILFHRTKFLCFDSQQILDILFTWTDRYPQLGKIKEAYSMLRTQGVTHEPQKNVIKTNSKKSTDATAKLMESDKLKRLLQSRNQKDVQAANLMIQNMVRDNDRRSQMQNRRLMDLQSAYENSILLKEMLDELGPMEASEDTLSTLREIYNNCVKLKPTIIRLAEETHESETFSNKVIETTESVNTVIELYTAIVINKTPVSKKVQSSPKVSNLLDVTSPGVVDSISSSQSNGNYSDLSDIFSSTVSAPSAAKRAQIDALLTPQVLPQSSNSNIDIMALINNHKMPSPDDLLGNFDLPSTQSPIKTLPKANEKPARVPLSEIDSIVTGMKSKLLSGPEELEPVAKLTVDSDDDVNNLISEEPEKTQEVKATELKPTNVTKLPVQEQKIALKDINLDINEIQPSDTEAPRTIMDEKKGLKILVNFTKDKPAKDVMVLVITVINQGPMAVSNFQFDASTSKPCKLRILQASGNALPGVKPFKPPTETINQVLLLMNPTRQPVNIMAILTYNSDDDEDPFKESIEVKDIPFPS